MEWRSKRLAFCQHLLDSNPVSLPHALSAQSEPLSSTAPPGAQLPALPLRSAQGQHALPSPAGRAPPTCQADGAGWHTVTEGGGSWLPRLPAALELVTVFCPRCAIRLPAPAWVPVELMFLCCQMWPQWFQSTATVQSIGHTFMPPPVKATAGATDPRVVFE